MSEVCATTIIAVFACAALAEEAETEAEEEAETGAEAEIDADAEEAGARITAETERP